MTKRDLKQILHRFRHPERKRRISNRRGFFVPLRGTQNDTKRDNFFSLSFLTKAAVLISLKESYLFFRNLYGLMVHPFKTIVEIRKKPDWSQTVLVFGLPVYGGIGLMGGMGIALVLLLFFNPTNELLINFVFFLLSCLVFLVSCYALYLGFWVGKYFVIRKASH